MPAGTFAQLTLSDSRLQEARVCEAPVITQVEVVPESSCGAADGQVRLRVEEPAEGNYTYALTLVQDKYSTTYEGLPLAGGYITAKEVPSAGYSELLLVREQDNCSAAPYNEPLLVPHACTSSTERLTNCGSSIISYDNCDGLTIYVNQSFVSPSTYIYLDDDYIGCIGYVDANCNIGPSQAVYCGDHTLSEPTPNNGYNYGEATFNQTNGLTSNLGISELEAERINWVIGNGPTQGYSKSEINNAIWHFSSDRSDCNSLCNQAKSAVTSVQGGIDTQMEVYMPDNNGVQPFILDDYICSANIDGLYINDDDGDVNVLQIQNGDQIDVDDLPSDYRLEAEISGTFESVEFTITGDDNSNNVENNIPYNAPGGSSLWNQGPGNYTVNIKVYTLDNAGGVLCAEQTISFSIIETNDVLPPTTPNCPSGNLLWQNNITNLSANFPTVDVRFKANSTDQFVLPISLPAAFDGPVDVDITEANAWDGYQNRPNVGDQPNERYKVVFLKNGTVQWASPYTGDSNHDGIDTGVASDEWIGSSGAASLPNGADEILLVHWSDDQYGTGDDSNPNSVVPSSVCIAYTPVSLEADAGADQDVCGTQTVTLSASASGGDGNYTYSWDNGLGNGSTQTVSVSETTTFTVTVTDGQGYEDTDQVTVNVTDGSTTVTATVPNCTDTYIYEVCQTGKALSHWTLGLPTCLDESDIHQVYLDGTPYSDWEVGTDPTCGIYGLKWDELDVENECAEMKVVFTAGYISQSTDWSGKFATCCSSAQTEGPSCDQSIPVTITGEDQICPGTTTSLTASGGDSYVWSTGEQTATVSVGPGTYTVTATSSSGCSGTESFTVDGFLQPEVSAGADVDICEGESTTLTATVVIGVLPYHYTWDNGLGDGASQTVSPVPSAYANESFTYNVTLTDGNGCTDTDAVVVTVKSTPDVTVSSTDPTCAETTTVPSFLTSRITRTVPPSSLV